MNTPPSLPENIQLKGVRQNNLKNIDVSIPLGSFTVICGPSGSGKSSLAFQTLFAEGQRRYIESLSNYSKQFINKAPKPDVDDVINIPPAIALQQKNGIKNSRSTVGTNTEILDHLRLLFAKIGQASCPEHHIPLKSFSPIEAAETICQNLNSARAYLMFPIYFQHTSQHTFLKSSLSLSKKELLKILLQEGFLRGAYLSSEVWEEKTTYYKTGDIEIFDLTDPQALNYFENDFYVIVDRFVVDSSQVGRVFDSLYLAYRSYLKIHSEESYGESYLWTTENKLYCFSEGNSCAICDYQFPPFSPQLFNFNNPLGACEYCNGFGNILKIDEKKVIPFPDRSLIHGAIVPFSMPSSRSDFKKLIKFCGQEGIDIHTPWKDLPKLHRSYVWKGHKKWFGVLGLFEYLETKKYKMHVRVFLSRYKSSFFCFQCKGHRLKPEINNIHVKNKSLSELSSCSIQQLFQFFEDTLFTNYERSLCAEILDQIHFRLKYLIQVGLGYLSLDRPSKTLSGGEFQRMSLAHQLGMGLSQTLFVLDEPTVGLHPRDNHRLIKILKKLHQLGNTLVVVEHDYDVITNGERIIELGPGAGFKGGEIIFNASISEFLKSSQSLTSQYIRGLKGQNSYSPLRTIKKDQKYLELKGAKGHNLKNVSIRIPLQKFTTVTGVSGSGKSSLITETLFPAIAQKLDLPSKTSLSFKSLSGDHWIKNIILMDQNPAGKTLRSNPATYLKFYEPIRHLFASTKESQFFGFTSRSFSLNVDGGRCPTCKGLGFESVDMIFMDDVQILCESCKGRRFQEDTLRVIFNGKNIYDVLEMTIEEAYRFFKIYTSIRKSLEVLKEVGLEHLKIGQSLSTLSGGENQRLKLAKQFLRSDFNQALYILDEPTTGLHFREIEMLLKVLHALVDGGASILLIEHNLEIIKNSDWIIDIGPEAGDEGGTIIFQGSPRELIKNSSLSYTSHYLKNYLNLNS